MLAPNISNAGYNAQVIKTTYGGTSNSIKATALGNNNADDDAAVAINQNPLPSDTAGIQQNVHKGNAIFSLVQALKDTLASIEGKMAEMREPGVKTFHEEMCPLVMSHEDVLAAMEEVAAKIKELWEMEIPSSSDVEKNRANLNLTL